MKTIGLVGGVASGKSRVAQMLVELGAGLLDADRAGHAVLAEDAEVWHALRQRWGDEVFHADGSVDRAAVARRVFAQGNAAEGERRFLEDALHPRIGRRLKAQRDQFAAEGGKSWCSTPHCFRGRLAHDVRHRAVRRCPA
jgi:dephospho-CoA kinase